jgi:hypothetical protein
MDLRNLKRAKYRRASCHFDVSLQCKRCLLSAADLTMFVYIPNRINTQKSVGQCIGFVSFSCVCLKIELKHTKDALQLLLPPLEDEMELTNWPAAVSRKR